MGMFRVKAKAKDGKTEVKMMAKHEMESGQRKDKDGNPIPAQFINNVKVTYAGNTVFETNMGPAISKNPYLAFTFDGGAKDETIDIAWSENTGGSGSDTGKIR
jgi:sulfur-oxidizing protein SoxZ